MVTVHAMNSTSTHISQHASMTSKLNAPSKLFRPCSILSSRRRAVALVQAGPISIHCGETTVTFNLGAEKMKQLNDSVNKVIQTFAEKQKAERPQRWSPLEYAVKGDPDQKEPQYVEVFCNPNAHGTAFEAKVLLTVKSADGVKITTEGKLTAFKADLDTYVS